MHEKLKRMKEWVEEHGIQIQTYAVGYGNQEPKEALLVMRSDHIQHEAALLPLYDLLTIRAQSSILLKVRGQHVKNNNILSEIKSVLASI